MKRKKGTEPMVKMEILRRYHRGGVQYEPGTKERPTLVDVPEGAVKAMEAARPPFGRRHPSAGTAAPAAK